MSVQTQMLGGRLPLLAPGELSGAQKALYDRLNATIIAWSDDIHFKSKTETGSLIGPFNPMFFSPSISTSFMDLHDAEEKYTSLSEQVRQVVILTVGAVWQSNYELYAHEAAARKAGLSDAAIKTLATGNVPSELTEPQRIAHRYARELTIEHRVDTATYNAAEKAFGKRGLLDLTYLTGIYHIVCGLLSAFEVPVPE